MRASGAYAAALGSTDEGEHDADNDDDDGQPNEQMSPAHRGAGHAAEAQ
jgi:hypothetical protein